MKTLLRSIYLLFPGLLFIETVSAAPEALFKKIRKEFTLSQDSTLQVDYYKELEINSLMALNRLYGETFIIYNPDYQKLTINESYTLLPNGDTLETPVNAFNEVLPAFAANAPAYNHLKEMVITHTGLEPQATIHLNYTLTSSRTPNLDIDEILSEESPVREYQIIINIPANQKLNYQLLNLSAKPEIRETAQGKQYTWTFKNLSPASHDVFQTKDKSDLPHLIANSYTLSGSSLELLKDNFHFTSNEDITSSTKEITRNCKNNLDKVFTIKEFISHQISTVDIPMEYLNWEIRTPEQVLQKAYGNKAEKVNLFVSMLESAGIPASVGIVYPGSAKNTIQGLKPIHQLFVYTLSEGMPLFLSVDGSEIISPELRGERDRIFLISSSEIRPLTVLPSSANITGRFNIHLKSQEALISGNLSISGGLIQPESPNQYRIKIKKALGFSGDSLNILYNRLTSFQCDLIIKNKSGVDLNQDYIRYILPEPGIGTESWRLFPLNSKRSTTLELPYPIKENYDYTIQLDSDMKLMSFPEEIREKQACGSVYIKITQKNDTIHVHREIDLPEALISPKEYAGFRKIMNIWEENNLKTLIIKKLEK